PPLVTALTIPTVAPSCRRVLRWPVFVAGGWRDLLRFHPRARWGLVRELVSGMWAVCGPGGRDMAGKIECAGCGKQYAWKPELAGKRAKCKCGTVVAFPAADPGGPATTVAARPAPAAPRAT